MQQRARWIPLNLTLFAFAACGGGGGSSPAPSPTQPPQSSTTAVSSEGVITGFGSVYVNDVRYQLDNGTRVVSDDEERVGDDSILRLGMRVSIDAVEQDGRRVAERIEHRRDVKGPVTRLMSDPDDPSIGTFYVANTRIVTDGNTIYGDGFDDRDGNRDIDIRDLTVDNGRLVVAVSGFAAEEGYLASRISRVSGNDDDDDELELKGFVTAVDLDASSFTVSGTTFAVTGATQFENGLVFDASLEDEFVEVEGVLVDGTFEAREVEREDDDDDDRSGRFEVEGILVSVDVDGDPDVIRIGRRTIEVTDAGALLDLVGSKLKIKGTFNDTGVLVIDIVRSREEDERVRTEDRVMSVDAASGTFTTRLGLVIRPEPTTRLEHDDDDDDDRTSPEDFLNRLRSNDYVEARGALEDDGSVRWNKIERDDDDDEEECKLRGPVDAIAEDQTSFGILGVTIDVAPGHEVAFEDDDDDLSRAEFFERLEIGMVVNARNDDDDADSCQDGLLLAKEVDLEEDAGPPFGPPPGVPGGSDGGDADGVVFLIIDEDSIDNGNPPNDFSETDVNDQLADIGLREPLAYFQDNVGTRIDLFTGQVGDEGWFALQAVPSSWPDAGPTDNGTRNYLLAGPGLGGGPDDGREALLDEIPDVTPLRATGLAMLRGETVCAVVYDSDVSINYSPLTGNLQGANLGIAGFEVLSATERTDGSDSDLPRMTIEIRDATVCEETLFLFDNAPAPDSSSAPFDVAPPAEPPAPRFVPAP